MTENDGVSSDALVGLSSLDDPVRRRLYELVAEQSQPVSREQAAKAVGIGRSLAAYHLDKLTDAGLLRTSYARRPGRSGPGAGRPAKLYSPTEGELTVSVPPRDYELLARLLAGSVEHDTTGTVREAANLAAYAAGQAAAEFDADLMTTLRSSGYRPITDDKGHIELRNCPFRRPAREHPELVCGLNRSLVEGIVSATNEAEATLDPRPGGCCVLVRTGEEG